MKPRVSVESQRGFTLLLGLSKRYISMVLSNTFNFVRVLVLRWPLHKSIKTNQQDGLENDAQRDVKMLNLFAFLYCKMFK